MKKLNLIHLLKIMYKKPYYRKVKCYGTPILDDIETSIIGIRIPVDIERKLAEAEISKGANQNESIVMALSEYLENKDYDVPEMLIYIDEKETEIIKLKKVIKSINKMSGKNL
jgi:hypothetical protein